MEPTPPPHPAQQPQPIVIRQETSPGTKIGVWTLVAILAFPFAVLIVCCVIMPLIGLAGSALEGPMTGSTP